MTFYLRERVAAVDVSPDLRLSAPAVAGAPSVASRRAPDLDVGGAALPRSASVAAALSR